MIGTEQMREAQESELSASIGALQGAARSLRDETGRVTAVLDGMARALDWERSVAEQEITTGSAPAERAPAARAPSREGEAAGQAPLWVPGLVCALALIVSLALVGLELALAIVVLIAAAVLLPMRWWMPALAAVALGLALAIQSSGPRTDDVAVMLVAFILVAGALLLYEVWQQLHSTLQA